MLPTEQPGFFKLVTSALAAYVKQPTPAELEAWWGTCRVFTLKDVDRALAAHTMDSDDGKRAPRPIDVKRRLVSGVVERDRPQADPHMEERIARHREQSIRAPSVVNTAWDIAKRHGDRPWQTGLDALLPRADQH
jgi:hypothetical protein